MKANDQTLQQLERFLVKVSHKFPISDEAERMTDIHVRVTQDGGELLAFDDDDDEITRCVVEQWIKSPQENFYDEVAPILRSCIEGMRPTLEKMSILRPFSFVLIDEDHETVQDLVIIDNEETMVIDGNLLEGLEEELDDFLKKLLSD